MRLARQRRRDGVVLITCEILPEAVAELERLGWLASERRADSAAITDAVLNIGGRALSLGLRSGA
jgi:hypothetical protein